MVFISFFSCFWITTFYSSVWIHKWKILWAHLVLFLLFENPLGLIWLQHWTTFTLCVHLVPDIPINPCDGNPCGPNSICKFHNYQAVCSCLPNYVGRAPNCRPECIMDSDCPTTLACICDKCKSPCDGTCGPNAHCTVLYHKAHCVCDDGFQGDPYSGCSQIVLCKQTKLYRWNQCKWAWNLFTFTFILLLLSNWVICCKFDLEFFMMLVRKK